VVLRGGCLGVLLGGAVFVLNRDRGVPMTLVIFGSLVVLLDLALRHTVAGRWIYAVGGNAEAARRAGINVTRIRIIAFMAASTFAAAGGILAAGRLSAVNQSSGGSDILLNAIAAAVIGGTSLFGGRGRAYATRRGVRHWRSTSPAAGSPGEAPGCSAGRSRRTNCSRSEAMPGWHGCSTTPSTPSAWPSGTSPSQSIPNVW
jgi:ABC-type branched-subunit amino acid transport system permease subunit